MIQLFNMCCVEKINYFFLSFFFSYLHAEQRLVSRSRAETRVMSRREEEEGVGWSRREEEEVVGWSRRGEEEGVGWRSRGREGSG
jgi:hypothetical protein